MNQKLDLQLRGLFTAQNNLSGVPDGALEVADNVVINSKNLVESRRGQTQYGNPLSIGSGQVNRLFNYASSIITNYDDKLAYDSGNGVFIDYSGTYNAPSGDYKMRSLEALKNFYFTTDSGIYKLDSISSTPRPAGVSKALGGTFTTTGTTGFLLADSAVAYRIVWGYIDANENLILGAPSSRLVVSNSSINDVDVILTFTIPDTITTEYFYQIYRSTGTLTATDVPSDELQLCLQGNCSQAQITAKSFTVTDVTPYSILRETLYTSPSQQGIANANNQPPFALDMDIFKTCAFYANTKQKQSLSMALISVESPSLGFVTAATAGTTNASAVITSIADTSLLRVGMRVVGTGIQTSSFIQSIDSSTQITMTKNATATGTVSLEFQDRFSIGNVNYYAGSTQDVSSHTFLVDTTGTPSQNINQTALNLLNVINTSTSNTTLYGYYLSGPEDLSGQLLFEERSIGGSPFIATSTSGSSFSPALPDQKFITNSAANPTVITSVGHGLTTGDSITIYNSNSTPTVDGARTVTVINADTFSIPVNVTVAGTDGYFVLTNDIEISTNETNQNRVYVSKASQPESVPVYRYFNIGSANFPIQRVVALRDGIFFFKKDGIYRISGETFESFVVTLLDGTITLVAPESAVPFNNQVFCYSTQGIVAVTDSGVEIKSVPIENQLLQLSSEQYTYFQSASFGVAYESSRIYMFYTVTSETDTYATQAFVYNSLTDSWTRWVMNRTCGVVNSSIDKLMMAEPTTGQILIERKNYNVSDYADEQFAINIVSVDSSSSLTLTSATNVEAGMTLVQGYRKALIENVAGNVITIIATSGFTTGAATVYTPIENKIQWAPIDVENPGILKQFSECTFFFRNAAFQEIDVGFATNASVNFQSVPITNISSGAWGRAPWGRFPWGGSLGGQVALRTYVPREKMRGSWIIIYLKTNEAFTGFSLQGASVMFNPMSSRFR